MIALESQINSQKPNNFHNEDEKEEEKEKEFGKWISSKNYSKKKLKNSFKVELVSLQ